MIKNAFIIISGPSGVGKSTLIQKMLQNPKLNLAQTISSTTRQKRPSEKDKKDYFFLSKEEFIRRVQEAYFLEWAKVYEHYYGTSKEQVENIWNQGKSVIKDLDIQGLKSVCESYPQSLAVAVLASSPESAKDRMSERGVSPDENKNIRIKNYQKEVEELQKCSHAQIINDDLAKAEQELTQIIESYLFHKKRSF